MQPHPLTKILLKLKDLSNMEAKFGKNQNLVSPKTFFLFTAID